MEGRNPSWESELWSHLSRGDGTHCPVYQSCQSRLRNVWCLSEQEEYCQLLNEFIDNDDFTDPASIEFEYPACRKSGGIFKLVRRLAVRYRKEAGIDRLPVPTDLITQADDYLPIEVREVPLKAYHGAVWRLNDCWVVHLNSNDASARRRFTLYHEIFHILAHSKATPVFRKASCSQEGSFNEMLADQFATVILLPREWVTKIWPEVKDISRMAAMFDVPSSIMWFGLKYLRLICFFVLTIPWMLD